LNFVTLLLAAQLFCPAPSVVNKTPFSWSTRDDYHKVQAYISCQDKYPASPCLKCFWKTRRQGYLVLCARKAEQGVERVFNESECEQIWRNFEKLRSKKRAD
jgi:hypothetical protein